MSLDVNAGPGKSGLSAIIWVSAEIKGISAQAKDIAFTYNGTLSDSGLVDVTVRDADLTLDFVMRPNSPSVDKEGATTIRGPGMMRYQFMRMRSRFEIYETDLQFHEETLKHDILLPMLVPFFKARIMDKIESGIEDALNGNLHSLGENVAKILSQSPNPLSIENYHVQNPL